MSAVEYIEHGWALCRIPAGQKGPDTKGWNLEANAIRDPAVLNGWTGNVGLLHAWSRTCALDIDNYQAAHGWLAARGVDLDQLMAAEDAVQIVSGRPGRAKLLYRLPDGVDLPLTQQVADPDADPKDRSKSMWLEFRCVSATGGTHQDVLPPSIHPGTGKPYRWGGAGDWRDLPVIPDALLSLWRRLNDESPRERKARGATGPGTSAAVMDMRRRVEEATGRPMFRSGKSLRGFCPVHGGESGTSFKIDEAANGEALVHCFAGCSQAAVLAALPPRDRSVPVLSSFEQLKASADARKAAKAATPDKHILPDFPAELLDMPHGLGELQRWILGTMPYPSAAMAGFTAWATLAHFAMATIKIESSPDWLGVNEQFLLLAPTGFGKESTRKPFVKLTEALKGYPRPAGAGNLWLSNLPRLQFNAPASLQGLHKELQGHRAQTFLADEFADWLGHSASDSHKQQALGYITQAYSKAFGTLAAPAAVTKEYVPVENPRVLVFATTTAEHILETITASHADRGALNRFVILVAEQDRLPKNRSIRPQAFIPPPALVDLLAWLAALPVDTIVSFDEDAWALYEAHDEAVLDPLKFSDNRLAGRLNEQAFKLAALIALSDRRIVVDVRDLSIAYAIREGLYHRAASLIGYDGALSGMHATGRALEQLRQLLKKKPFIFRSHLEKVSHQYSKLHVRERDQVVAALIQERAAKWDGAKLVSTSYEEDAT